jgi:cobalamin biosynthesis Mg chelatase CobN
VVELLDDMFQRAAAADEPEDMNWIKAHARGLQESGEDASASAARLFSNPAGDYGSMVNERVGASNWSTTKVRSYPESPPLILWQPAAAALSVCRHSGTMHL